MKRHLTNEKGLTLVELLSVLVIGSIIILLLSNIMVSVQKQYKGQSTEVRAMFDVTYALKVITKDFRMAESIIEIETGEVIFIKSDSVEITYRFNEDEKILYRNTIPFVSKINIFKVTELDDIYTLEIEISSENGRAIETELIQRK